MNIKVAHNLLLFLLFVTPVYSAIDQVVQDLPPLITTHSPYAYKGAGNVDVSNEGAGNFDVSKLGFSLTPGQEYRELMDCLLYAGNRSEMRVPYLFTILWNDFASTDTELWKVYLWLARIPNSFDSMYTKLAFDLALQIGDPYCICESYLVSVLKRSKNQHNVVFEAVKYIYGYKNKDGVNSNGHGLIIQKYKILKFFLNIDWRKYWGTTASALKKQRYYIKALIRLIEGGFTFIIPILQYEAYEKAMHNYANEHRQEHAIKAYKLAVALGDMLKIRKIRDYAFNNLGLDRSSLEQW